MVQYASQQGDLRLYMYSYNFRLNPIVLELLGAVALLLALRTIYAKQIKPTLFLFS